MAFTRQNPFSKKVTDLPDKPSPSYTASDIKTYIETPSDETKTFVDNHITELEANTGAGNIGAKKADGTTSDVQTTLDEKQTKVSLSDVTGATKVGATKEDGTTSTVQGALDEKAKKGTDWLGTWQGFSPSQVDQTLNERVNEISVNVKAYGAIGDGVTDDTQAFINAINYLKTSEYTETVPTNGTKAKLLVPSGKYLISAKINIPSYVKVEGVGKNSTIIVSNITNGDPVFEITNTSGQQQFYCEISSLTVFGNDKNCIGIKIYMTSRWVLRDVMIDRCNYEGLWLEKSYLGEVFSIDVRACGGSTHSAVYSTGATASDGSHAVTFVGGEFNGGTGTGVGFKIDYGISVSLLGVTIEGFNNGAGIENKNANSLLVNGCYFESNKENIIETSNTLGSSYINNYFAQPVTGARGHIGIYYAQGAKIEGNYFVGNTITKIFDSTGNSTGKFESSSVRGNYAPTWPISIDQSLKDSARSSGTIIESYDATTKGNNQILGHQKFMDDVTFNNGILPNNGIDFLNQKNVVIKAGSGSPEGAITATRGLYLDEAGAIDSTAYIKKSGTNNSAGWLPTQIIFATTTANRPTVSKTGYMMFDSTLNKPIWWNGVNWVDATGVTV